MMLEAPPIDTKRKMYFGKDVDTAILEFQNEPDSFKKNQIFKTRIWPAFSELVHNVIFNALQRGKPYYCSSTYEDLKLETITFLYEKIEGFDPTKGRGFSYFNMITKNYILAHSQNAYWEMNSTVEVAKVDMERDLNLEYHTEQNKNQTTEFTQYWISLCRNRLEKMFPGDRERNIADAVLTIFENVHYLDIYNKKALYILIKEQIGDIPTLYITQVINDLKTHYKFQYKAWIERQKND